MPDHMLSADEAAEILGLQVRTVRNYVREGRLPGVRIGKQYRIARADLEAFTAGAGSGEAGLPAGPAAAEGTRTAQPTSEVSSVVQIEGIGAVARDRLERTITAATLAAGGDGSILRVEPLYDDARERLRLIIVGGVGETAELLRVIERFSLEPD